MTYNPEEPSFHVEDGNRITLTSTDREERHESDAEKTYRILNHVRNKERGETERAVKVGAQES